MGRCDGVGDAICAHLERVAILDPQAATHAGLQHERFTLEVFLAGTAQREQRIRHH